ncbi:hypothetical protein Barb4_03246 [Bacteroidales bacterium Barb4]|nr:hypothetical protein Barb4_03246 [Bacteroidales bacterium Barb4]
MQRSGMWGYKDDTNNDKQCNIYICNIRSFFQNFLGSPYPQTPHSAPLHVGLKSGILSGYPWQWRL